MGLLRAGIGALSNVMADQWREFFYRESFEANVLASRGRKRVTAGSSNTGSDNIISDGSIIAVNEGQCAIITENGAIVDVVAEAGEFVYDMSTEPSMLYGPLGEEFKRTLASVANRFTFGGGENKVQRVYYFNTKEIVGNKYGTPTPVPFRVVDTNIGLDLDTAVRCNGEYSYRIVNPVLFYKNVCGNVEGDFTRDKIDSQLKSDFLTALQPALGRVSDLGIRYSSIPTHVREFADAINAVLDSSWGELRGIEIASVGINSISIREEDEQMIKDLQRTAVMRDPTMRQANESMAHSEAVKTAAGNAGGVMMGVANLNMMGTQAPAPAQTYVNPQTQSVGIGVAAPASFTPAASWTCPTCGTANTGNFCGNCGTKKPEAPAEWFCTNCGTKNTGKFCSNCGHPRA